MIPSPSEVVRRQWTCTGLFRMAGIFLGVLALLSACMGVSFAISLSAVEGWRRDEVLFTLFFSILSAAVLAVIAGLIFGFSRFLARKAAVYPASLPCPRCFYGLEGLVEPRCPECGLDLTPEFLAPGQSRPAPDTAPQSVIRHRMVFAPIIRLLCLALAFPLAGLLLPLVILLFENMRRQGNIFDEPSYVASWIWWLGAAAVVGSGIVFSHVWARVVVPGASADQIRALGPASAGRETKDTQPPTSQTDPA